MWSSAWLPHNRTTLRSIFLGLTQSALANPRSHPELYLSPHRQSRKSLGEATELRRCHGKRIKFTNIEWLFVSYSKKMDRDVLNSPASLNYRKRCIVNTERCARHRFPNASSCSSRFSKIRESLGSKNIKRITTLNLNNIRYEIYIR